LRTVIDQRISAEWKERGIQPASVSSDAEFMRRVSLDLIGVIPSYDEAAAFLDDKAEDKRAKLVERLLADPRYAQHQMHVWDMVYFGRNPPGYYTRDRDGFQRWLNEQFASNTPYNKIAESILKAEGNTAEQGAPMYLVQFKDNPEDATVHLTQTFLGIQLQCARCHDHPYESWTQLDFYGFGAFLARLEMVEAGKVGKEKKVFVGEQEYGEINFTGPASEEEAGQKGKPVPPKFLLGEALQEPETPEGVKVTRFPGGKVPAAPKFSRKTALADWIISEENPFFARAVVNRIWSQFMGRGLVHPVDNMSESNPPTHPELLIALAQQFVEHKYDMKWLINEIVLSDAYQLSSTGSVEIARPMWFEQARTRPLSAEELAASWRMATNYEAIDPKAKEQLAKDFCYPLGGYQVRIFGSPNDGVGDFLGGMHEHLYMNNGGIGKLFSNAEGGLLRQLAESEAPAPERIEQLYLTILSRRPTAVETERFVEFLSTENARPHDLAKDAIWALMTCSEFRFNH